MSILDTINNALTSAFLDSNSAFRPAVHTRVVVGGSALGPTSTKEDTACRAFASNYSERLRNELGIPDGNIKIAVMARNDLGETLVVTTGDLITLSERFVGIWAVVGAKLDPAGAIYSCEARPVEEG